MRIIFMGTPIFSLPALENIFAKKSDGIEVIAIYTQPPKPKGRGLNVSISPIHEFANKYNIKVFTPLSFKDKNTIDEFIELNADLNIVSAYGQILPKQVLFAPKYGSYNIHASLLPRWRGAAPIQRAIMAGDKKSGITIMKMDEGLDTGDMLIKNELFIDDEMTAGELHDSLSQMGAELIIEAINNIISGNIKLTPQDNSKVTYAKKISKKIAKINFDDDALNINNHIRGLSPFPAAWFEAIINNNKNRIIVKKASITNLQGDLGTILDKNLTIACGSNSITLELIQPSGKKPMSGNDYFNGMRLQIGDKIL